MVQLEDIVIHTDAAVATLRDVDRLIPEFLRTEFAKNGTANPDPHAGAAWKVATDHDSGSIGLPP